MADVLRFGLEAPEACPGRGFYLARTYIARTRDVPRGDTHHFGRRPPDMNNLHDITDNLLNRLPMRDRKLIGFSMLKLCDVQHELRLERVGNYAFVDFAAKLGRVVSISYKTPEEDVCWVRTIGQNDQQQQFRHTIDFPLTQHERDSAQFSSEGQYLMSALASDPDPVHGLHAEVVVRPQVKLVQPSDMKQ